MSDNGKSMKQLLTLIVFVFMDPSQAQEITINKGIYASYYHMAYQLDARTYTVNTGENVSQGGQFEVLEPKKNSHACAILPTRRQSYSQIWCMDH